MTPAGFSFQLSGSDIHIWILPTTASDGAAAKFERVLHADETDRAARFHFSQSCRAFVVARGALRYLLGRYLRLPPADIRFNYGLNGKPALASGAGIQFNVTRSGSLALIAFAVERQIGIDLEQIRPLSDMQHIAERFFCPEEASEIMSLPELDRERAFFCCWTRKEAYVKAIGDGLVTRLDRFRVTVQPNIPARFVHIDHNTTAAETWTLEDLRLASDYAAALAYRDQKLSVSLFPIVDLGDVIGMP